MNLPAIGIFVYHLSKKLAIPTDYGEVKRKSNSFESLCIENSM